ncbi:Protein kinase domain-containing protein [Meloidogyne graminicola]|uniref:Protein kinase domain-containing protein n=1 Tax=Meloidogyne graminicola TaxID=189291 RepID=A0A8S9ZNH9_9BILA|nr:Protein kinase domain-containing protein [Meloidogyne graminicola]
MKELVIPSKSLMQLHKVALHLDFKPENLVFIKKSSSTILKIIDFGGSIIMPEDKNDENAKINITNWTTSIYFLPPETNVKLQYNLFDELNIEVSRKTDSWQFGIMILEFILFNENRPCPAANTPEANKWKENIINKLTILNKIFTLLIYKKEDEEFEELRYRFRNEVILKDNYIDEVKTLLKIRKEYSNLFILVSNLMIDQDNRLSMKKIHNFNNLFF